MNRKETKEYVERNGIVTLKADKSAAAPEVDELLKLLGHDVRSLPFYAIFPSGQPNRPILFDGFLASPRPVIDALKQAGPSRSTARLAGADDVSQTR